MENEHHHVLLNGLLPFLSKKDMTDIACLTIDYGVLK